MKTVKEIIIQYLEDNNFDGLKCNGCDGCSIDNLFECNGNNDIIYCRCANIIYCSECDDNECENRSDSGHCLRILYKSDLCETFEDIEDEIL